ncbi:2-amino-4-hydroxy-6-hydroxymethyldihydropteridine diphosphokinase [Pantoea sp. Aalb]|uniref:2-amino-4-hydroxy-6- hydroxymethyldihydropteridine diphosphokinase n=1 Tax=Pantoea sp. Aalb TaxID=2576762 RepID=UPI0013232F7B|nr:2-amino-4-hydroxy-6-hydroxymethyldihydropteridine diphosphokinase [Pantoea sp. Aalb]MXP67206.1 2-amino-4-hydroxy-6-hydroxymethyldihydropteridine diphosphokinase [Pantoea sp. Aalb]
MNRVYLSLGSNLANPLKQVYSALAAINAIPKTNIVCTSSLYRTPPYGLQNQPDFLNAAVALDTTLKPEILLNHIQRIELEHGRIRNNNSKNWEARTLDLDIMLFGKKVINTPRLTIPHYDMYNRAFMLVPLVEIMPKLSLLNGITVEQLLAKLDSSAISLWVE